MHHRIRHHVPTGKARIDTTLCFCMCVCVDVRFCVKWSLRGIDSSWDRPLGVCVLRCDGHWWSAEGGLATVWQSRLFAEEVTRNPGGNEEDMYTLTQTHVQAAFEESRQDTILDITGKKKHHVIFALSSNPIVEHYIHFKTTMFYCSNVALWVLNSIFLRCQLWHFAF